MFINRPTIALRWLLRISRTVEWKMSSSMDPRDPSIVRGCLTWNILNLPVTGRVLRPNINEFLAVLLSLYHKRHDFADQFYGKYGQSVRRI